MKISWSCTTRDKINLIYRSYSINLGVKTKETSSVAFFLFRNFKTVDFEVSKRFEKYLAVDNVVDFQKEIHCIFSSVKMTKSHKMTKSRF
jgi:hypothetical protein